MAASTPAALPDRWFREVALRFEPWKLAEEEPLNDFAELRIESVRRTDMVRQLMGYT